MYLCSRGFSTALGHPCKSIDARISVHRSANNRESTCSKLDKPVGESGCIRLSRAPIEALHFDRRIVLRFRRHTAPKPAMPIPCNPGFPMK